MESSPTQAIAAHWPEYLIEATALGAFMLSASVFTVLLEHPMSWLTQSIPSAIVRRGLIGLAMGATAVGIMLSPWGQRSGAHMNPSVTLAFLSLRKIAPWDAAFYIAAQVIGGLAGMQLSGVLLGQSLQNAPVDWIVTIPGPNGWPEALAAEFAISAILMAAVLLFSNSKLSTWTPFIAGTLIAIWVLIEAPISGMSMNPARTLGSAVAAASYPALWIYFVGPPIGMFLAAQLYRATRGISRVYCAKLHHDNAQPCIFRCRFREKEPA